MTFPWSTLRRRVGRLPLDCRSGRLLAVIHCVLDQNVRDAGAASFPASNWAVLDLCREYQIGLLQMPCPELRCLGMSRNRPSNVSLRAALDTTQGRACCRQLAEEVADVMAAHTKAGRRIVALLGGNSQSPGCAVHQAQAGLGAMSGIFMLELEAELRGRRDPRLEIPFLALRDADPQLLAEDLGRLEDLFNRAL